MRYWRAVLSFISLSSPAAGFVTKAIMTVAKESNPAKRMRTQMTATAASWSQPLPPLPRLPGVSLALRRVPPGSVALAAAAALETASYPADEVRRNGSVRVERRRGRCGARSAWLGSPAPATRSSTQTPAHARR